MKVLKFEGAGCVPTNDVENCRIRTTFKNDRGEEIYLEMNGHNSHSNSPGHVGKFHGFISHLFFTKDVQSNYSPELSDKSKYVFEYSKQNILRFINRELNCSFDTIEILNEGYDGFKDQDQKEVRL